MSRKIFEIPLDEGFTLLCRKEKFLGRWVDFAVVLVLDDECITRYDASHGYPHRDILGRNSGLIRKEKCLSMNLKEAFQHGIDDLSSNYKAHFNFYSAN